MKTCQVLEGINRFGPMISYVSVRSDFPELYEGLKVCGLPAETSVEIPGEYKPLSKSVFLCPLHLGTHSDKAKEADRLQFLLLERK